MAHPWPVSGGWASPVSARILPRAAWGGARRRDDARDAWGHPILLLLINLGREADGGRFFREEDSERQREQKERGEGERERQCVQAQQGLCPGRQQPCSSAQCSILPPSGSIAASQQSHYAAAGRSVFINLSNQPIWRDTLAGLCLYLL
eukprot:1422544-Rhodomonas_salina.1